MKRKILSAGRFVIPRKFASKLGIKKFENLEISVKYGDLCISKFDNENLKRKAHVGIIRKPNSDLIIQIPKEYMKLLKLKEDDFVECYLRENKIIICKK
ncbi:MAG: hypothetical protein E7311_06730 [Clostridiales bacterium]|nr:hypothetical protein [Clostridiales bacterium]